MLRMPMTQMQQGITYLGRVPDDEAESLKKAAEAMRRSIRYIMRWCEANDVDLGESMKT